MANDTESTLKPFHDSIVDSINRTSDPNVLAALGQLIRETTIPKNHEAITTAWCNKEIELGLEPDDDVPESVARQAKVQADKAVSASEAT